MDEADTELNRRAQEIEQKASKVEQFKRAMCEIFADGPPS